MKLPKLTNSRLLLLAACFATHPAWAADINVPADHATIQAAINAAADGDAILVADGTYVLTAALNVGKELTINGQSEAGVIIDASGNGTGYGIKVEADNVTLQDFTLLPPIVAGSVGTSGGGGFPIHATFDHGPPNAPLSNLTLANITIEDSNRAAFDVHGYDGVMLTNLTARRSAYGNGIQLTGCTNVTATGCTTEDNAWGGLAIYCSKSAYLNRSSSDITIDLAANSIGETLYVEDEFGLVNTNITVQGASYLIDNDYNPGTAAMHMYTDGDLAEAVAIAAGLNAKYGNAASTVVNTQTGAPVILPGSSIQTAVNAASPGDTIEVAAGSYGGSITITKAITLLGANAGVHPVVGTHPTETAGTRGAESVITGKIYPQADDITIDGFTIDSGTATRVIDTYADANSFEFRNNIFLNTSAYAPQGVMQFGGGSHTDCVFEFNQFETGETSMLYTGGVFDRLLIQYNKISCAGDAIFWTAAPLVDGVIKGNEIDGTIGGVPGAGFCTMNIGQAGNLSIEDNWVHDVHYTAFQVGIIGGQVINNTFENTHPYSSDPALYGGYDLYLWGGAWGTALSANVEIAGNTFRYDNNATGPVRAIRLAGPANAGDPAIDASTISIHDNKFIGGGAYAGTVAIRHQGDQASELVAPANYWGTSTPVAADLIEGNGSIPSYYVDEALTTLVSAETWVDDDFASGTPGWGLTHFATVQEGVGHLLPGGTVNIAAGTYVEQVEITAPVVLQGDGEGQTIIQGFASMPLSWTSSAANVPIIYAHGTNGVEIYDLTVDGDGQGNSNYRYQGIAIVDAGATVEDVTVTGVSDTPFSGAQHGVGIYAYNTDGTDRDVVVRTCTIPDFQKGAIALNGPNAVCVVEGCTITGAGPTGVTAQNGIQLYQSRGVVRNNIVSDIAWTGGTWVASGLLFYDASDTVVEGNIMTDCQAAIYATNNAVTPQNLEVLGNTVTGAEACYIVGYDGVTLTGNSFSGGPLGLNIYNTVNVTGSGNTYDANEIGLWIDGTSDSVAITGDTYTNNTTAGAQVDPDATGVSVTGSTFTGNLAGLVNGSVSTVTASPNYWGAADGPSGSGPGTGDPVGADVAYSPWWVDAGMTILAYDSGTFGSDYTVARGETLEIPETLTITGGTFLVDGGTLVAGDLDLQAGAVLNVVDGELTIDGSTLAGSFTFFNSMGSVNFNGDVNITGSAEGLILVCDVHVVAGATITVDGSLVIDGCTIDSPGSYSLVVNGTAEFTMARTVMINGAMTIGSDDTKVYDNRFETSTISVTAGTSGAQVYHNLTDSLAWLTDSGTGTVTSVDGWGNLDNPLLTENNLSLGLDISTLADRTTDADGNVYIQPTDTFTASLDVSALQTQIAGVEVLLGYSTDYLATSSLALESDWDVLLSSVEDSASVIGKTDAAIGWNYASGDPSGSSADQTVATVSLTGVGLEGETMFFHRVKLASDTFGGDTRLTTGGPSPAYLAPFTVNSGAIVVDGSAPTIDEGSIDGIQTQASAPSPVDVLDPAPAAPPAYVFRNGNPVILTFTATDAGLAGLDPADVDNDLVLTADNGITLLDSSNYTVVATEAAGVVTYTVTLDVPVDASNGVYAVTSTVLDRSGNISALADLGVFEIADELLAKVELQNFTGGLRDVTFVATDAGGMALKTWINKTVDFTGAIGSVGLEDVPPATVAISAKTEWNLRSKVLATFTAAGVGTADLTGADLLPGGDLNGDNLVNTLDYSILRYHWVTVDPTADIDGDGGVGLADYNLLKANFYTAGDPE